MGKTISIGFKTLQTIQDRIIIETMVPLVIWCIGNGMLHLLKSVHWMILFETKIKNCSFKSRIIQCNIVCFTCCSFGCVACFLVHVVSTIFVVSVSVSINTSEIEISV